MAKMKMLPVSKFLQVIEPEPPPPPRFVLSATDKKGTLKALDSIEKLFGPKGEHWTKGEFKSYSDGFNTFCLVGAAREADGAYESAAHVALSLAVLDKQGIRGQKAINEVFEDCGAFDDYEDEYIEPQYVPQNTIIDFNDADSTKWSDVKDVLRRARKIITKAPTK